MLRWNSRRTVIVSVALLGLLASACGSDSKATATTPAGTASGITSAPATTTSPATTAALTTVAPTTVAPTTAPPTAATVAATIRGTAYTFNTPDPIAGATVKVEELPDVSATTRADGSYELAVPQGATVTPYIEAAGHHSIHLQTFTVDAEHDGTALEGVNFQTPSDGIYNGLKALIGGFTGKDPFQGGCVIVTTVGDARMVGMTFDQFINFHPHGVQGASVQIDPASATPIYFNDQVLPDQKQKETSVDGGVLFANVPPGTYTLSATKPGTTFATIHVNCQQDWVVNANPVWGLHAIP
jgi:hypothetical protein